MASYYIDVVLDLDWFVTHGGKVLDPRSRSTRKLIGEEREGEFWFFGDDEALRHLRVVIDAQNDEDALNTSNRNIVFWRDAISVTSVIATSHYTAVQTLGANSSAHVVLVGQGDIKTPTMVLNLTMAKPIPANFEAAAHAMANWDEGFRTHLHYLGKFMNPNLPADVRWLHGYRFLEWHFERGKTKLGSNKPFKSFLDEFGGGLDRHMPHNRTRAGFLEEIRATLAHALLADRPSPADEAKVQSAATNTFPALEEMVIEIMNQQAGKNMAFTPKPLLEPPAE